MPSTSIIPHHQLSRVGCLLILLLLLSFAGKAALRLVVLHDPNYWGSGYSLYFMMAENYLRPSSSIKDPAPSRPEYSAIRPPLYPFLIAAVCRLTDYSATAFVLVEALISTAIVALVYTITARLAPPPAPLLAAFLYAFYPYSFYHDTQLQDTVLHTALSLAAVACLLPAFDGKKGFLCFLAGVFAGAAIVTRVSHSVAALFLLGLILFIFRRSWGLAWRCAAAFGLGTLVLVGPWLVRNKLVVDRFTLTSETGYALACAHNPYTFQYYPYRGSIDKSWGVFSENLPDDKRQELARVENDEMAADAWFRRLALDYIQEHPWATLGQGFYKVAVNFAGVLSPLQGTAKNTVYTLSYWALMLLALGGLRHVCHTSFFKVLLVFVLAQATVSFVFWAHTSHRSWLDPLFAVPAGIALATLPRRSRT